MPPAASVRYRRGAVIALLAALAIAASLVFGGEMDLLDALVYDLSLTATSRRPGAETKPVAVIALDPDSLASPELAATPRVFLSPQWARLTDALLAANVRAIGFDIIFVYSANAFPAFAAHERQYDQSFLAALHRARDRVVLARSARAEPHRSFFYAVFDPVADAGRSEPGAIAYAELAADGDGVFRHMVPWLKTGDGQTVPTFAAALLRRAKGPAMPNPLLLAPRTPLESLPAYRLIDVLRCSKKSPAALREAFAGKVVLIGSNLPEEDRKRTPDRFMPPATPYPAAAGAAASPGAGCRLDRLGASDPGSGTSPGVFVHAAAVSEVLTGNLVRPVPSPVRALAAGATAAGGALFGFALGPVTAAFGVAAIAAACLAAAPLLLGWGLWFPAVLPAAAAVIAMLIAYIVRFLVEERRRRRVQNAFGHYLAPAIVDTLVESEAPLRLGGEAREVTIMFADLSGFTALSGRLGPEALMQVTNAYLALIVAAVEATGGYVDKFIGDAVMGIWGAPAPNPDHAAAAAHAALRAVAAVMRAKAAADARGEPGYSLKIGLNSGPAVIGNVGAEDRYNYTAVGETVNIASRLEGVPGDYACRIVAGPATAAAIADRFVLCELDWIKVKGKEDAIAIYELVAERDGADPEALAYPERYRAALALYRAGDFAAAEDLWRRVHHPSLDSHSPPLVMAERAAALRVAPPEAWDGVYVKTTK
ncbi:MAG TPA: adenylate/guanylate cyclase domain-containing protein [Stellaceae bacterium]|nr:adenylate/guanylate cyclase domain-containing protein [Stellaceae bacterium]